jgi:hypothetical protein
MRTPVLYGRRAMKSIQAILAVVVVSLLIVDGAIDAARADDRAEDNHGVTLYTSRSLGDHFICTAVNVSDKTLGISFAILGNDGKALSCASPITCLDTSRNSTTNPTPEFGVLPGTSVSLDMRLLLGTFGTGYCAVAVSGTGHRDDVRAAFAANLTDKIPGTTIPILTTGIHEAH